MSYQIQTTEEPVTWAEINWSMLDEEGFEAEHSIEMRVALVDADRYQKLANFTMGLAAESEFDPRAFVHEVSRNWRQIAGPDKKPFPFIRENVDLMIGQPGFLLGWNLSYIRAWNGKGKVREKNSESSPDNGRADEAGEKKPLQ